MSKLLSANFARLKTSKTFWLGMAVMALFAVSSCLNANSSRSFSGIDSIFFSAYIITGILIAIFCGLFIGTEYSDGAIRNKLVVGHGRSSVYLSNFITCAVVGLFMDLIFHLVILALGIPLVGTFQNGWLTALAMLLTGFLMTLSFAAVFSLLVMLNQNKALASIISIVVAFAAIFGFVFLYSRLQEPEFYAPYVLTVNGVFQQSEPIPNPYYLNEVQRALAQFAIDFFPTGQAGQFVDTGTPNLGLMSLYSVLLIIATNAAGVFFFRRKDLK